MNPKDIRPDDREALSALFDGELDAEARLFALRRLGHDAAWQQACGQWQLIGDAMRRNAPIAAPADFAGRVTAAVAAEALPPAIGIAANRAAPAARSRTLRWIGGGALAASIALAVTVATFPFGREPVAEPGTTIAATPAPAAASGGPRVIAAAPAPAVQADSATAVPARVAPAILVSESASPRLATATRRTGPVSVAVAHNEAVPDPSEAALLVGQTGNPFNLDADETLTARPWPRATLTGGAFTARYGAGGDSAGERPSFYPFEPRPHGEASMPPTP